MKRTQADYSRLAKDPTLLFGSCNVILRDGAIFIQSADGRRSIKIEASDGPAGLGINFERSVFGAPLTVSGNLSPDYEVSKPGDFAHLSVCQYRSDDWSQAFKAWYGAAPSDRDADFDATPPVRTGLDA